MSFTHGQALEQDLEMKFESAVIFKISHIHTPLEYWNIFVPA